MAFWVMISSIIRLRIVAGLSAIDSSRGFSLSQSGKESVALSSLACKVAIVAGEGGPASVVSYISAATLITPCLWILNANMEGSECGLSGGRVLCSKPMSLSKRYEGGRVSHWESLIIRGSPIWVLVKKSMLYKAVHARRR